MPVLLQSNEKICIAKVDECLLFSGASFLTIFVILQFGLLVLLNCVKRLEKMLICDKKCDADHQILFVSANILDTSNIHILCSRFGMNQMHNVQIVSNWNVGKFIIGIVCLLCMSGGGRYLIPTKSTFHIPCDLILILVLFLDCLVLRLELFSNFHKISA